MTTRTDVSLPRLPGRIDSGPVHGSVAGAVAGVVAALSLSLLQATDPTPTLVGAPGTAFAVGSARSPFGAVAFGTAYGAAVYLLVLSERIRSLAGAAKTGLAYGLVPWLVVAVPLAVPALGYTAPPAVPTIDPLAAVGDVAFGLVACAPAALRR